MFRTAMMYLGLAVTSSSTTGGNLLIQAATHTKGHDQNKNVATGLQTQSQNAKGHESWDSTGMSGMGTPATQTVHCGNSTWNSCVECGMFGANSCDGDCVWDGNTCADRTVNLNMDTGSQSSDDCANGYVQNVGDIPGWGEVDGEGGGKAVPSCKVCADLCDDKSACQSFECSPTEKKCNLNVRREPTHGVNYQDYRFCMKPENEMPAVCACKQLWSTPNKGCTNQIGCTNCDNDEKGPWCVTQGKCPLPWGQAHVDWWRYCNVSVWDKIANLEGQVSKQVSEIATVQGDVSHLSKYVDTFRETYNNFVDGIQMIIDS